MGTFLIFSQAAAGTWTANEFSYKPALGARGETEKNTYDSGQDRVDARLGKEYWVGDPKHGSTIQNALDFLGSTNCILRIHTGTHSIAADLTVPANLTLAPERGAILSIATGKTLTINSGFQAGLYQVFSCAGTGKVVFGAGVSQVLPQWWGAKGDGSNDDTVAIQAALTTEKPTYFPPVANPATQYYKITATVFPTNNQVISGSGMASPIVQTTAGTAAIEGASISGSSLESLYVKGGNVPIYFNNASKCSQSRVAMLPIIP